MARKPPKKEPIHFRAFDTAGVFVKAQRESRKETNGDVIDKIVEKLGGKPKKSGRFSKRGKYHAIPTTVDGVRFASKKEARRYQELKLLLKEGKISSLELQVPFKLEVYGFLICKYVADFTYYEDRKYVVEDVKGMRTREYKLKAKLMFAVHGLSIRET